MSDKHPAPVQHHQDSDAAEPQHRASTAAADTPAAEALQQSVNRLQALYGLTAALSRANALTEVYEAAITGLHRALGIKRTSILLFDPDGVMRFKAAR